MASRIGFIAIVGDPAELAGQRVECYDQESLAAVKHIRGEARKCLVLERGNMET